MTLQKFLNNYKDIIISEQEKSLLEKYFDELNKKYSCDTSIEADPLYLTIQYVFDKKSMSVLSVLNELSKNCIYDLNRDHIPSIIRFLGIKSYGIKLIQLFWSLSGENATVFAHYCSSIDDLTSCGLNLYNKDMIRFVCYCLDIDTDYEIIKDVITMRLDFNNLNTFHDKNQKAFNTAIRKRDINTLIRVSIENN